MNPVARRTDVVVQQVGTDVLVYDQLRDAAHSLDPIAAFVYAHADGTRDVDALAQDATAQLGVPNERLLIEEALAQLARAQLVDDVPGGRLTTVSRRTALRRLGLAAAALPLVTTLAVPAPVLAQSSVSGGSGGNGDNGDNGNHYGNDGNNGNGGNNNGNNGNNGNHYGNNGNNGNGKP